MGHMKTDSESRLGSFIVCQPLFKIELTKWHKTAVWLCYIFISDSLGYL